MGRTSVPQTAAVGELLERGVWKAPWLGPHDEVVLLGITSQLRLVAAGPVVVKNGTSLIDAADSVWDAIEADEARRATLRVIT